MQTPEQLDALVVQVQRFTRGDSPAWSAITNWSLSRIDQLRDALEVETNEAKCAEIRGEIRGLRSLLALPGSVTQVEQAVPDGLMMSADDTW